MADLERCRARVQFGRRAAVVLASKAWLSAPAEPSRPRSQRMMTTARPSVDVAIASAAFKPGERYAAQFEMHSIRIVATDEFGLGRGRQRRDSVGAKTERF